jgi:hypothetical protein
VHVRVEIRKMADSGGLLRCTRADGTVAWQKQQRYGPHFALHDLTHFTVETVLGYGRGFFGLIEAGWDIEDTTGRGARGALPVEVLEVESIVGGLDAERASGTLLSAPEFNEMTALQASNAGRQAPRVLTEDELLALRKRRAELFRLWAEVDTGAELVLEFAAGGRR